MERDPALFSGTTDGKKESVIKGIGRILELTLQGFEDWLYPARPVTHISPAETLQPAVVAEVGLGTTTTEG
jgi:hypothetical protein